MTRSGEQITKKKIRREHHHVSIPTDLIHEILSRLSEKSRARFRCVSKQWRSILISRPRLLLVLERANMELFFFSSLHPQNQYDKSSSLVVTPDLHMKFSQDMFPGFSGFTSDLIYSSDMQISNKLWARKVYNINTGQYVALPDLQRYRKYNDYFGFDPLDKQYKVLFMAYRTGPDDHRILTLGTGQEEEWRKLECPFPHDPLPDHSICINGVLYYIAEDEDYLGYVVICFDVRSETFKLVEAECFREPEATKLINCKGKLCGVDLEYNDSNAIVLYMWVLEDVDGEEWSEKVYTLPVNDIGNVFVVGMTSTGEIVLSEKVTSKPFYVFYFSPERNTLQRVEIRGPEENHEAFESECRVYAFVDYVVDSKGMFIAGFLGGVLNFC